MNDSQEEVTKHQRRTLKTTRKGNEVITWVSQTNCGAADTSFILQLFLAEFGACVIHLFVRSFIYLFTYNYLYEGGGQFSFFKKKISHAWIFNATSRLYSLREI